MEGKKGGRGGKECTVGMKMGRRERRERCEEGKGDNSGGKERRRVEEESRYVREEKA